MKKDYATGTYLVCNEIFDILISCQIFSFEAKNICSHFPSLQTDSIITAQKTHLRKHKIDYVKNLLLLVVFLSSRPYFSSEATNYYYIFICKRIRMT